MQHNINLNYKTLEKYCAASIPKIFKQSGGKIRGKPGAQHVFLDNGAHILTVVHADTVQKFQGLTATAINGIENIFCSTLDDRLGIYTALEILPQLGILTDILITENEEKAASTAKDFIPEKNYNWILGLDRSGKDVVTYDYDWPINTLKSFFKVNYGTFSDICCLDHLECLGFNLGIGYHDEHSSRAYMIVPEYLENLRRLTDFYTKNSEIRYQHIPSPYTGTWDWNWDREYWCKECIDKVWEEETIIEEGIRICITCGKPVEFCPQ